MTMMITRAAALLGVGVALLVFLCAPPEAVVEARDHTMAIIYKKSDVNTSSLDVVKNNTSASAARQESKVVLKFCAAYTCQDFVPCYCCLKQPVETCFDTWEKCQAACPACNPKCD